MRGSGKRATSVIRPLSVVVAGIVLTLVIGTPVANVSAARMRPAPSFVYPVMAPRVSSGFGTRNHPVTKVIRHHSGIDLAAPAGSLIRSIRGGTVIFADKLGPYGNLIVVDHGDGFVSRYGHCETLKARIGQRVKAGQIIATVGQTGRTTGPHLHFEVMLNGKPFDPDDLIPGLGAEAEG